MAGHHLNYRHITERIYIAGTLILESPAHFGAGQPRGDALTDMSLLLDEQTGRPLIPGTTIAGALRNYLREGYLGYYGQEKRGQRTPITRLFGPTSDSREAESRFQSLLIVDDALGYNEQRTLRDGVRIDPRTGTAYEDERGGAKFDVELLEAGTRFDLHFEVLLTEEWGADEMFPYLIAALQGFEQGAIRLGLRKRRGYGQCLVEGWQVRRYALTDRQQLCEWLETPTIQPIDPEDIGKIEEVLTWNTGQTLEQMEDRRSYFDIRASFGLKNSSLLIRSGFGEADSGPDMVHLHSLNRDGKRIPVISGTTWAGVIRHRAQRIVNTIAGNTEESQKVIGKLFGDMPDSTGDTNDAVVGTASKVTLDETEVQNGQTLYQTRVRIDRFTGGALETALFEQAPIYGKGDTSVGFHLHVRAPKDYEKGLLLLILKDLWTGDLPVGGEASIGRGRLQGAWATICDRKKDILSNDSGIETPASPIVESNYTLNRDQSDLNLTETQRTELQTYVNALWDKLQGSDNKQEEYDE